MKRALRSCVALALMLFVFQVGAQPAASTRQSAASAPKRIGYYDKQGYPKEQSAAMLDPDVRALLDAVLRLYRESVLSTNGARALGSPGCEDAQQALVYRGALARTYRGFVDERPRNEGFRWGAV